MFSNTQRNNKISLLAVQKSMYYFEKLYPATDTYHYTIACELLGNLNTAIFEQALRLLLKRHTVLQSSLIESNGQIYIEPISAAHLNKLKNWPIQYINAQGINPTPSIEYLINTLGQLDANSIITHPFALNKEPLWRCVMLQLSDHRYQFAIVIHHIIIDVTSKNVLMRDLSEIYNALLEHRAIDLPPLPRLEKINPPPIEGYKLAYWKNTLHEMTPLLLKGDFIAQRNFQFRGNRVYFEIDKTFIQELSNLAKILSTPTKRISLHQIFLASLYVLLYRYSGQSDICIGTASANRQNYLDLNSNEINVDDMVSCFVNSIPLRLKELHGDLAFKDLLQLTSKMAAEAYKNQLPFDVIVNQVKPQKTKMSTASPFDIIFNLNQKLIPLSLKNIEPSYPIDLNLNRSKFAYFGLNLDECSNENYKGFLEFNTDHFKEQTIIRLKDHLINIWTHIVKKPEEKISDIPLLTPSEKIILTTANHTEKNLPSKKFIQDIFSETAALCPNKTAVVFHQSTTEIKQITYSELNHQSTILADLLVKKFGIRPEKNIGISVTRSINLVTAIWSAFKTGGVVVPLETKPSELLYYKVRNTHLDLIIVDNETEYLFSTYQSEISTININHLSTLCSHTDAFLPKTTLIPNNTAYITYTSGTTSTPKGVMIPHIGLTNLAYAIQDRGLTASSKVLCTAPPTFDCFFFEMLEALMTRGEMHLIFEEGRLSERITHDIILRHHINAVTFLPHISNNHHFEELPSLNDIIIMGSVANEKTIERLMILASNRKNSNSPLTIRIEYGVSEASVCSTEHPYHPDEPYTTIGKPIRNTRIFILDKEGKNECPIGVPGELYIEGLSLASGYFNNEALTNEKFLTKLYYPEKHQFENISHEDFIEEKNILFTEQKESKEDTLMTQKRKLETQVDEIKLPLKRLKTDKNESTPSSVSSSSATRKDFIRLYKTGDLVRRLDDGSIEFIGRIDNNKQVKIHGVRIELDSIETILQRHPNIKAAIITFNPEKETLNGYLVLINPDNPLTITEINHFILQSTLPRVARLSSVFFLEKIPLNSNGKIDYQAIAAIAVPSLIEKDTEDLTCHEELLSPLQEKLKSIWEKILNRSIPSINNSFEELGGDSLSLAMLETQINHELPLLRNITLVQDLKSTITIKLLSDTLSPLLKDSVQFFDKNFTPSFFRSPPGTYTQEPVLKENSQKLSLQ